MKINKKTTKQIKKTSILLAFLLLLSNVFGTSANALTPKKPMISNIAEMAEISEKTVPAEIVDESDIIEPSKNLVIFTPENNIETEQTIENFVQTYPCEFILSSFNNGYIIQTEPISQSKYYDMTDFTADIYNNVQNLIIEESEYKSDHSERSLDSKINNSVNIKNIYEIEKTQNNFVLEVNTEYKFFVKYTYEDVIISYNGIICIDTYSEKSDGINPIVTLIDVLYNKSVALTKYDHISQYNIEQIESAKELAGIRGGGIAYESEPNDTDQTANQINENDDVYGTIDEPINGVKDIDWYEISITTSGYVDFTLTNIPSGCDYDLYVYCQSNTATLIFSSTKRSNTDELIRINVTAGTCYIKVISYSGYDVSSCYIVKAETSIDDYGNDINTAFKINVETTVNGCINYGGDLDYFKFTAPCSGMYIIESSGGIDTHGKLFDNSGTQLAYNDDGGVNYNFKITFSLTKNSVYYIEVRHYNSSTTGNYSIRITAPDDYGNSFNTAFLITDFNTACFGTINYNGDLDFFTFTAPVTGEYIMYTMSYQSQNTDTYGYLYDSSQSQLAYNDDGNGNYNFKIIYTLTEGQIYYIKIKHYSSGTGDYLFKIDVPSGSSINSSITKNITNGNEFLVICSLNNITSFAGITYKIIYDTAKLTLIDFAAQTPEANITVGIAAGTDLEILSHNTATGILTFKINKTIPAGSKWSGAATILKFKAKATGSTILTMETN